VGVLVEMDVGPVPEAAAGRAGDDPARHQQGRHARQHRHHPQARLRDELQRDEGAEGVGQQPLEHLEVDGAGEAEQRHQHHQHQHQVGPHHRGRRLHALPHRPDQDGQEEHGVERVEQAVDLGAGEG
jgi:hypothetical protein